MRAAGITLVVGRRALRTQQWPSAFATSLRRTCTTSGPHTAAAAVRVTSEMERSTARVLRPFSGGRRTLRGVVFDMDGTLVRHQGSPPWTFALHHWSDGACVRTAARAGEARGRRTNAEWCGRGGGRRRNRIWTLQR